MRRAIPHIKVYCSKTGETLRNIENNRIKL